jgi:hypothetical protein
MPVCPPPHITAWKTNLCEKSYRDFFTKMCRYVAVWVKIDQQPGLYMKTHQNCDNFGYESYHDYQFPSGFYVYLNYRGRLDINVAISFVVTIITLDTSFNNVSLLPWLGTGLRSVSLCGHFVVSFLLRSHIHKGFWIPCRSVDNRLIL